MVGMPTAGFSMTGVSRIRFGRGSIRCSPVATVVMTSLKSDRVIAGGKTTEAVTDAVSVSALICRQWLAWKDMCVNGQLRGGVSGCLNDNDLPKFAFCRSDV